MGYNPLRPSLAWEDRSTRDRKVILKTIDDYRPHPGTATPEEWAAVRETAVRWARSTESGRQMRTYELLGACAKFAAWLHRQGRPLDDRTALTVHTIDEFIDSACAGISVASQRNYRILLAAVAAGSPTAPQHPPKFAPRKNVGVHAPYTPADLGHLWTWADSQPSRYRHDALVLLSLSLGAGLYGSDYRVLRGSHVQKAPSGPVLVCVPDKRPRTTVVLAEWADVVLGLADGAGDGYLFRSHSKGRTPHNLTNGFLSRSRDDHDTVKFRTTRARTTWIVRHLVAGTPFDALATAAGVTDSSSLVPYLRYTDRHLLDPDRLADTLSRPDQRP